MTAREASQPEIRRTLQDGVVRLRALEVGPHAHGLVTSLVKALRQRDYNVVMRSVTTLRRDLAAIDAILGQVYDRVTQSERAEADAHPLGPAWWNSRRRVLEEAAGPGDTGDGAAWRALWTRTWIDALAAGHFDRCDEIADLARSDPDRVVRGRLRAISAAFAEHRPENGLPDLTALLASDDLFPTDVTVRLTVLRARIYLRRTGDTACGGQDTDLAVQAAVEAGQTADIVLARAVAAEVELELGDPDGARRQLDPALAAAAALPTGGVDAFVVAGMLAEHVGSWHQAEEFYDAAVARGGAEVAEPRLLRPVPANLLWRLSRQLEPEQALAALDQAIELGVQGKPPYPERKALIDKARLLEQLERPLDAAAAYEKAGDRYAWSGMIPRALSCYQKACELAPDVAEYRWDYGEALRMQAVDNDLVVDVEKAAAAAGAMRAGLALQQPDRDTAWVLSSAAMLADALGEPDATLLAERALLLNDGHGRGYAALSMLLRLDGFVREAWAAAAQGHARDRDDILVVDQLAEVLADRGDYRAALAVVDEYVATSGQQSGLAVRKALLHLRVNEPDRALAAVAESETSDVVRILRALAQEMSGDADAARRELEAVWLERASAGSRGNVAWAAYRTGRLDEAVEILEGLAAKAARGTSHALDLGLVLLARGDPDRDDLATGARCLLAAVEACCVPEQLVHLVQLDLPVLRDAVTGHPEEDRVAAVAEEAERRAMLRHGELQDAVRPPTSLSARTALARTARADGSLAEAVDRYLGLLDEEALPEARLGLRAAVEELTAQGDDRLATDLSLAREAWSLALRGAEALPPAAADLAAALRARIVLAELELNGPAAAAAPAAALLQAPGDPAGPLAAAVELFARDVQSLWRHRTGLRALADQSGFSPREREVLAGARVPLAGAYRLRRDDVAEAVVFPLVTPVEVWLGTEHAGVLSAPSLGEQVQTLRKRLSSETGVRIPGVQIRVTAEDAGPTDVITLVYDQLVDRQALPVAAAGEVAGVLDRLELAIRDNLFRLISPDDVQLWLEGWDGLAPGELDWSPPDMATRLRLVRVVRLLLREGLPVADRAAVVAGFREAEAACSTGPLDTLRAVRRRLVQVLEGTDRQRLPEPLERRVAEGIRPGSTSHWELDRSRTARLLDDLQAWWRAQPDGAAILVADPVVRPFVWRLLALSGPRVTVLAEEETR